MSIKTEKNYVFSLTVVTRDMSIKSYWKKCLQFDHTLYTHLLIFIIERKMKYIYSFQNASLKSHKYVERESRCRERILEERGSFFGTHAVSVCYLYKGVA